MLRLLRYLNAKEWCFLGLCVGLIVTMVWLELEIPNYMKSITNLLQTPGDQTSKILTEGLWMLGCALGVMAVTVVMKFFSAYVSAQFGKRLRKDLYVIVQDMSMHSTKKFSVPSLITRTTNDITQVQMVLSMGLQPIIYAPVMAIWGITVVAGKSWQWSVATAVAVFVMVLVMVVIFALVFKKFKIIQKQTDELNKVSRENLVGVRVVRAYNAENYQSEKFETVNEKLTKTNKFANKVMAVISPAMTLILSGLTLAIYWLGAIIINNASGIIEQVSLFSDMVVFSSYAMYIVMAFMMLAMVFIIVPRAQVSANRINAVLNTKPEMSDGGVDVNAITTKGKLEFRNVDFRYPDAKEECLEGISFVANKGETIAIIGSTGSGKTSLINLIPRIYDATNGEVLVDDVNVKDYKFTDLYNKIGYVSQSAVILSGTIKENIALGQGLLPSSDEEVNKAIAVAQAKEFIEKIDEGVDFAISQGGKNLSGGQKQRISIARAISRNPEFLIMDDSFSALDYKTDKKLRKELRDTLADATKIIVAQRIGTIKDADLILVLEKGKLVGKGKHKELLQSCKAYQEIALSQLSKEEL